MRLIYISTQLQCLRLMHYSFLHNDEAYLHINSTAMSTTHALFISTQRWGLSTYQLNCSVYDSCIIHQDISVSTNSENTAESYPPSTEDGSPPPPIVLDRQLKVGQSDRDACRYAQQNGIDDKQNTIECVLLASPQCSKDVVELHRYSTASAHDTNITQLATVSTAYNNSVYCNITTLLLTLYDCMFGHHKGQYHNATLNSVVLQVLHWQSVILVVQQ